MCIYCDLWGDGMTWYLNPKNYPRHMYTLPRADAKPKAAMGEADPAGFINAERAIVDAMEKGPEEFEATLKMLRDAADLTQGTVGGWMGQAVPLRDAERMVEIASPLGLIGCICRLRFLGIEERSKPDTTCMGLGVGMLKWERWPERYKGGVYWVSSEEAKEWLGKIDIKHAPPLDRPLLIIHGGKDVVVPNPKDQVDCIMNWAAGEKELRYYPDGEHCCANYFDEVIPYSIDWLRKHLLK